MNLFQNNEENRRNVRTYLITDDVILNFTKADGSDRRMRATLRDAAIDYQKSSADRKHPDNNISQPVWDLDANAWRSFRWDSLKSWEVSI